MYNYALCVLSGKDNIVISVLHVIISIAFSSKLHLIVAYKFVQVPCPRLYSTNSGPIEYKRTNTK